MEKTEKKVTDVKKLEVFKLAHSLVLEIYKGTNKFPKDEMYGLTSQLRRASISIGSNLSEGANKSSKSEFRRYVNNAKGSVGEILYQLLVAKDLEYLSIKEYENLSNKYYRVIRMLERLSQALRQG